MIKIAASIRWILSIATVLTFVACGGGSGGGSVEWSGGGSGGGSAGTSLNEGSPTSPINLGVVTSSVSRTSMVGASGDSYYTFKTNTVSGSYTISLTNTKSDLSWSLFTSDQAWLQNCDNSYMTADESCASVVLAPNTIYYLIVKEWNNVAGTFTLTIDPPVVPSSPIASAGPDQNANTGSIVTLDGSESSDPNADPITFSWSFTSRPVGSMAVLSSTTAVNPTFTPDVDGNYAISLVVSDGSNMSLADTVTITAYRNIHSLGFRVIDAEYSKSLDKIIMVSSQPSNQLHIYDPASKTEAAVNLNLVPTSVSVSPDGMYAAVGHNAWVSYVNLSTGALVKTLATTADVIDVVLAGNGYVYAFPRVDQWEDIRSINIATGAETLTFGIYAGTRAKLHPSGTSIYGADVGLSPSDIEKYSITGGTAAVLYDSPYHGDYAMCGDLWMSEDGLRIFTKCGNVFRASPNRYSSGTTAEDMTYNGALENLSSVLHLTHSSAASLVAAIPAVTWPSNNAQADREVQLFNYNYLTFNSKVTLPHFVASATSAFPGRGRFVFYNNAGTSYYVVVQADSTSGMLYDYGVVTY